MKFPVRAAVILASFLCGGCTLTPEVSHGPISERLLKRLDEGAISRSAVEERVKSGQMRVYLAPPRERTVTLPFEMEDGTPQVTVRINGGRKVRMVLDTGAVKTMIQASVATASGVTMLRQEDAEVSMRGVIGDEKARLGILEPLQIGAWSLYAYPCIVRTHENTMRFFLGDVSWSSNLLGLDVAAKLATYLTLDYPRGVATYGFHDPFPRPQGRRVGSAPLKMVGGAPFITVKVGKHSWDALVDSGSFNGIEINEDLAKRLGVGKGEAVEGLLLLSVGGSTTSKAAGLRTVKVPAITLLGETYREAQVDVSPGPPRVGSFFLKDYRVTFDFKRKLVWLEW